MKIGIIGDIHLSANNNFGKMDPKTQLNTRLLDLINTFNNIIDTHIENGVEVVCIVGDVYTERNPAPEQVSAFSRCLMRAIDKGIKKILINVGNHDQSRTVSATSLDVFNELKIPQIQVFSNPGFYSVLPDLHLIFMPYRDRRMLNAETKDEAIKIYKDKVNEISKGLSGKKIFIAHQMIEKQDDSLNGEACGLNELVLPLSAFSSVDFTISGHVHRHSIIRENPPVICSGSMDKVSFGERNHSKVSLIINEDLSYNVIPTQTRNLIELKLDYSDKLYKKTINEKILHDIQDFDKNTPLKDAIVKVIIKVRENDSYFVSQAKIKGEIMSKNIKHCSSIFVSAVNNRQLRDDGINETVSPKKAIATFINNLAESSNMKEKLIKLAEKIIKEVGNK